MFCFKYRICFTVYMLKSEFHTLFKKSLGSWEYNFIFWVYALSNQIYHSSWAISFSCWHHWWVEISMEGKKWFLVTLTMHNQYYLISINFNFKILCNYEIRGNIHHVLAQQNVMNTGQWEKKSPTWEKWGRMVVWISASLLMVSLSDICCCDFRPQLKVEIHGLSSFLVCLVWVFFSLTTVKYILLHQHYTHTHYIYIYIYKFYAFIKLLRVNTNKY